MKKEEGHTMLREFPARCAEDASPTFAETHLAGLSQNHLHRGHSRTFANEGLLQTEVSLPNSLSHSPVTHVLGELATDPLHSSTKDGSAVFLRVDSRL